MSAPSISFIFRPSASSVSRNVEAPPIWISARGLAFRAIPFLFLYSLGDLEMVMRDHALASASSRVLRGVAGPHGGVLGVLGCRSRRVGRRVP